jgi:type VI secretion system VasD/TssJ family lipoprotein
MMHTPFRTARVHAHGEVGLFEVSRYGRKALLLLAACLVAGCGGTTDRIVLTSSPRLNMCNGVDPHPVVVRIYYLRGASKFSRADFEALWENDTAVLGDDRIQVIERTLNPREQLPVSLSRSGPAQEATSIGVVANFCRPGEGCWRRFVPIEKAKAEIQVHVDEGCLSID